MTKRWLAILAMAALAAVAYGQPAQRNGDNYNAEENSPVGFPPSAASLDQKEQKSLFRAKVIPSHLRAAPGESVYLAISMLVGDGWSFYSPEPGGTEDFSPQPAKIAVTGPFGVAEVLWPPDRLHKTELGATTVTNYVYEDRAVAYVKLKVPATLPAGSYNVHIQITGERCSKASCQNVELWLVGTIEITPASAANPAWDASLAEGIKAAAPASELKRRHATASAAKRPGDSADSMAGGDMGVWAGLGLAVVAGLILNIMPCVLPVIPLRILSVIGMAGKSRRSFVTMGLAFALGILLFFAGLAAVNLVLKLTLNQAFNWSEHLQNRGVRIVLAMLVVALAANLLGAFNVIVPSRVAGMGQGERQGHWASVGMGLMMAVLATPCSFAILAAVMTWAQGQTPLIGTLAFLAVGMGMAAPHSLLAAFPGLVSHLPRPGRWMELFKQAMGFLLLLTAVWLIGTMGEEAYTGWVAAFAVVLVMALWMWGTWVRYDDSWRRKLLIRGLAVVMTVLAGLWMLPSPKPLAVRFEPFDPARIESARAAGQVVLVKFTASWCASCKVVDFLVYDNPKVAAELQSRRILVMKGDVSNANLPASGHLAGVFHKSPPLTVIYPPRGEPLLIEGEFSPRTLFETVDRAAKSAPPAKEP